METLLNSFTIAFGAIFTNKTRSFLTMLGVIIGVGSVILLTSIGNGLQSYVTEQFNSLGANNIYIMPGDIFGTNGGGFSGQNQVSAFANNKLRLRDVAAIKQLRSNIREVVPMYRAGAQVSYQDKKQGTSVVGTSAQYSVVLNTTAAKGRFFTQEEDDSSTRVAVLGSDIATKIFGEVDPIGKRVKIGSENFRVIGVAAPKGGGFGGPTFDTYVYVPFSVSQRMFNTEQVMEIIVEATSKEEIPQAIDAIKKELGKRLKSDEFSVVDQKEILSTINQILGALTAGLGGIAAISLIVGGIGILNIMLVSVIERTREIGLRKAIGATPNVILMQFLIEAATLSIVGGMIGTSIAYGLTLLINKVIPATVTLDAVALAFGVSAAIGIIFGVIPARRASKLSPIEALRYE